MDSAPKFFIPLVAERKPEELYQSIKQRLGSTGFSLTGSGINILVGFDGMELDINKLSSVQVGRLK
jgi:hypothetical protein